MQFMDQSGSILSSNTCFGSTGCRTSQESSSEEDKPPAKVQCIIATCTNNRGDAVSGRGSCGHGLRGRGGRPCDTVSTISHLQTEDQSVPRYVYNVFT